MVDITVFISCYNEQVSIVLTLEAVSAALIELGLQWEILVIDDCSTDGSVQAIQKHIEQHRHLPIRYHVHTVNLGMDRSIVEAAQLAQGQYFWCVAGDNPVSKETCLTLLACVGKADIIIPDVRCYVGRRMFRRILSRLYSVLVSILSGLPIRYYNGSSIFLRTQFIQQMEEIKGFSYSAELIISLIDQGCTYLEVPVLYRERQEGKSSAVTPKNIKDVLMFFGRLLIRACR